MLRLNLRKVFALRGIERPYTFLVKAGISPHSATNLIHSSGHVFRLDHIELICSKFNCTPNDILEWAPSKKYMLSDTHPLNKLKADAPIFNYKKVIENLPIEQLQEIASLIREKAKPPKEQESE